MTQATTGTDSDLACNSDAAYTGKNTNEPRRPSERTVCGRTHTDTDGTLNSRHGHRGRERERERERRMADGGERRLLNQRVRVSEIERERREGERE